ncbi:MAG TPA: 30S ribosomal protein S18 [Terriglobales bacterium]|nr:30S ribosomal protein S18 [Terriglobales bacterium]
MADEVKTGETTSTAPTTSAPASTSTPSTGYQRPAYGARREGSGPRPGGSRPGGAGREGGGPGGRKFFRRKKVCKFCVEKIDAINYKDVRLLSQFVAEKGKIVPRRLTGVCTPHQRRVSAAIKQARNIALLPFAARG